MTAERMGLLPPAIRIGPHLAVASHVAASLGSSFGATLPFGAEWRRKSGLAQQLHPCVCGNARHCSEQKWAQHESVQTQMQYNVLGL